MDDKMRRYRDRTLRIALWGALWIFWGGASPAEPAHVILMIGDGMGQEHVNAAGMYAHGSPGGLSFESFPVLGEVLTHSLSDKPTDSAAAATAMATGVKVENRVVSIDPSNGDDDLLTILEIARDMGKRTGLVVTSTINHATPAPFAAHARDRGKFGEIAEDYMMQTRPNVLFGGEPRDASTSDAVDAGYLLVTDKHELAALDTESATHVAGFFGEGHMPYERDGLGDYPHLSEMTVVALNILDNDPDGFFLMVEGARMDHAAHDNDIDRNIGEMLEFAHAVQFVLDWAAGRSDTLILVTADHETGGLSILENNGVGQVPTVSWETEAHTPVNVPIYGWGANAQLASGLIDNINIFWIMHETLINPNGGGQATDNAVRRWRRFD